ncbi:MAG: hypothetical protein KA715_11725 [Xanthomonadaceae bacterium]|nr:hypothetical protein [Xanthomonadaceae bacterium]
MKIIKLITTYLLITSPSFAQSPVGESQKLMSQIGVTTEFIKSASKKWVDDTAKQKQNAHYDYMLAVQRINARLEKALLKYESQFQTHVLPTIQEHLNLLESVHNFSGYSSAQKSNQLGILSDGFRGVLNNGLQSEIDNIQFELISQALSPTVTVSTLNLEYNSNDYTQSSIQNLIRYGKNSVFTNYYSHEKILYNLINDTTKFIAFRDLFMDYCVSQSCFALLSADISGMLDSFKKIVNDDLTFQVSNHSAVTLRNSYFPKTNSNDNNYYYLGDGLTSMPPSAYYANIPYSISEKEYEIRKDELKTQVKKNFEAFIPALREKVSTLLSNTISYD